MNTSSTQQPLPVFAVEVTETVTTRYRVRAADVERAQEVATDHNIEDGSERGEVITCERDVEAYIAPSDGPVARLEVIDDPQAPPQVSVGDIADQIPAWAAQMACAAMMATLGGQAEWSSETVEWVAAHLVAIAPASVPTFTESAGDSGAVEFWQNIDTTTPDPADGGQDAAWQELRVALTRARTIASRIAEASDACDIGRIRDLEEAEVDYLKAVRDAAEEVRRGC
ncbi:hypothetical protein [Gordonia sp. OPL2]|uniref:hypothetical protein n=1 Tax=Gordonia sp. OPL2 TaxID=2486274 RepID=UPI00165676B6|nr:hypothetical protein [Gordonia sp. OPL2]ROZ88062.1 hypothetical protein EEB19_22235 [Gordonia sp. OPL2]